MDGLGWALGLSDRTLALAAALAVIGALLGGALAHWCRGRAMIVTGAIVGAILLPLAAIAYMVHFGMIIVAVVVLAVLGGLAGLLGG